LAEQPPSFALFYFQDHVRFDRDIYRSVDAIFSRIADRDEDVKTTLNDLTRPTYDSIHHLLSVDLPVALFKADDKDRKIEFSTEHSSWSDPVLGAEAPSIVLALDSGWSKERIYEWRVSLYDGVVQFNSAAPRDLELAATIEVGIRCRSSAGADWQSVEMTSTSGEEEMTKLVSDVTLAYRRFLKTKFDVSVSRAPVR